MSADESKAIIQRLFETVWNGKNLDALDEFYAAEYRLNGAPNSPEQTREVWRGIFANTPDMHLTIEDTIIAEGDKVAYRWASHGTNTSTGKPERYRGMTFLRIADGKIVEDWYNAEAIEE